MTIRKFILACLILLFGALGLKGQTNISGVVNVYNTLAARIPGNCGDTIYVTNLPTFAVGDLLLFYNAGGASFDTSNTASFGDSISLANSGKYAFAYVSQVSSTLMMVLDRSIGPAFGNGTMVVHVPEYNYANVSATVTAPSYLNGVGGIVAISANKLRLSADIDVSEKGFPGGFLTRNMGYSCGSSGYRYQAGNNGGAPKGEGIGSIAGWMKNGRGHFLNGGGGGNNHNAGGGGGANGGAGGKGGDEWIGCNPVAGIGGLGGQALVSNQKGRLYFGGGGGSGHNNVSGLSSEGGIGGGIILLLVDTLEINGGSLKSDGGVGKSISNGAEGAGGGGAGGTIVFSGPNITGILNVYARGGSGGNCTGGNAGPGGGGGGGVIWLPQPSLAIGVSLINGGNPGHLMNINDNYGSIAGSNGAFNSSQNFSRPQPFSGGSVGSNFLGNDTLICAVDSILLSAPSGTSYLWSTGATTQSIYAQGAGIYWVQVQIGGCIYTDSMRITNYPGGTGSFLGPNRVLCTGTSFTLGTTINGNYLWSTGATTSSITINSGGWYWLDIQTGAACPVRDSVYITEDNFAATATSVDTAICASEFYEHFYPLNWLAFWPDGGSGTSFEFRNSGNFIIPVFNENGCERLDTIRISTVGVDTIVELFTTSDTTVCRTDGYPIDFSHLQGQVLWSDGIGGKIRNLGQGRRYIVRYEEGCYSTRDTLDLTVIDCDTCQIFFPNAFSPNADGLNDTYRPISACEFEQLEIRIIDRWGELIYESTSLQDAWDGTFKGSECMQGIYIYDVIYRLPYQNLQRKSGVLHLRH